MIRGRSVQVDGSEVEIGLVPFSEKGGRHTTRVLRIHRPHPLETWTHLSEPTAAERAAYDAIDDSSAAGCRAR